ncbi:MAG TPA: hypothetical protein VIA06_03805 [Candidatus Dormibacteraeota bacterium]|jgi:predicted transcriptional regulator|nr:hypothetical protein [Candidatus Dormibacteraeota bacterium]
MRTLLTQARLKRLIRMQADAIRRLDHEAAVPPARTVLVGRLISAAEDVRMAWRSECPEGMRQTGLGRHVTRQLAACLASIAALERRGADVEARNVEFRDAALPLLFFLRGLEDTADDALAAWLGRPALARSA